MNLILNRSKILDFHKKNKFKINKQIKFLLITKYTIMITSCLIYLIHHIKSFVMF